MNADLRSIISISGPPINDPPFQHPMDARPATAANVGRRYVWLARGTRWAARPRRLGFEPVGARSTCDHRIAKALLPIKSIVASKYFLAWTLQDFLPWSGGHNGQLPRAGVLSEEKLPSAIMHREV